MTRKAKWWTALSVTGLALVIAFAAISAARRKAEESAAKKNDRPPLEFAQGDLARLSQQRLETRLAVPGTLQAISQATVRAKLAAEVRRVVVREGERVAAGQVLAEFDTAQVQAQIAERAAALASARAQLANTERTRRTNAMLVKQSFISQNAFDAADAAHQAQLAAVAMAQAQLEQAELLLADAVVRAPIQGVVARRHVQPGEKVGYDAPLVHLVDLTRLEVQAQVPVADVARVRQGMPARVEVEGLNGRALEGRVERINPSAEAGSRNVNIYVTLPNEESVLRVGMFARVMLSTSRETEVPALPVSALREEAGQSYVWVIKEGRLARRIVGVGTRDGRAQLVEITSGIAPAELVLATKFDNLKEGLAVKLLGAPVGATAAHDAAAKALRAN